MAEEAGLSVDRTAFDSLMADQRARAKADAKAKKTALADLSVYSAFRSRGETVFTGYTELETESSILGLIVDGASVDRATEGQIAEVILGATALYAESGGQDADAGTIVGPGYELEVLDVQKPVKGLISHKVLVRSGEVGVGAPATSLVDREYRRGARQAHSGTHIIHAALRQVLGPNAHQSGSYNKAGYLRLDFSWNQALSTETRTEIEEISNNAIRQNLEVTTRELPLAEAKALGAMALFGEKYGDTVRVVDIGGPWSRELCAGTHVASSSEIGMINLVSESSVGSTNRRVESLVGLEAFRDLAVERTIVSQLSGAPEDPAGAASREDRRPAGQPEGGREADRRVRGAGRARQGAGAPRVGGPARRRRPWWPRMRAASTPPTTCGCSSRRCASVSDPTRRSWPWPRARREKPVVIVATNQAARDAEGQRRSAGEDGGRGSSAAAAAAKPTSPRAAGPMSRPFRRRSAP